MSASRARAWPAAAAPFTLSLVIACLTPSAAVRAQQEEGENAWLSGPEVPLSPEAQRDPSPPRESSEAREPLNPPPHPPDPWVPPTPSPAPDDRHLRMHTSLTREELWRFGDFALSDALVVVPGLHFPRSLARGELPAMRGLGPEHTDVRLDGVPLVPASTWPRFPLLGMLDVDSAARVTVLSGPRLRGIGGVTGAAGAIDIQSVPPPVELGEGLALAGSVRGGYGGPDLEKAIVGVATTGFGRVRFGLSAGAFDADDLALGRGAGLLEKADVLGGHLGARVDVTPREGLRTFAVWRSARHGDNPYPLSCAPVDGEVRACTFVRERALDLLYAGLDHKERAFGWGIASSARAYAQHLGEKTERSGRSVATTEVADDFAYRGGAGGEVTVTAPPLPLAGAQLGTELGLTLEALRDRVVSRYGARSRRTSDALPPDVLLEDSTRTSGLDDSLADSAALGVRARARWSRFVLESGARLLAEKLFSPGAAPEAPPSLSDESLTLSADLVLSARLFEGLRAFGALTRTERNDTLYARTLGPQRFISSPEPALDDASGFLEHGAELGLRGDLPWLASEGVLYVARRSGVPAVGIDPRDDDGVERFIKGPERSVLGVEGRLRYRTFVEGLSGLATLGALAIDEGDLLGDVAAAPASAVTPPFGVLVLDYRPPSSWFGAFARLRYALPQARLSPTEAVDPVLCPEAQEEPQRFLCRGSPGVGLFDLGANFAPSERLRADALVENVLDAPWQMFGHPLPGGGLGVRFTLTLRL